MAVIGKIRERSGLLLVIVGGAMAAFILTDLFSSRGAGRQDAVLGEVAGEEIGVAEFERRVSDEVESYRNDFGQQVNAEMQEQVRGSVWNEMVKAKAMLPQVLDAGFSLSPDEYNDIRFGENILPDFRNQPNFQGPDGKPDPALLKQYFENVQAQAPMYHEIQKRRITENRLYAKYNTLVKKSVFVNTAQARDEYEAKNTRATFSFVAKRYDTEPDSLYEVSDQDLRRFYDAHKNERKYAQKPSRKFVYTLFPVKPSEEDRLATMQELASMRQELLSGENDSLFIVANSD
ncbi:MAG: SurA N-terminal domain-containing protein, partial [Flavobacteriales bacterium]|nr:SurA N-terminal domain-containing protein [Flavobacteriales bacterium]